MRPPQETCWYNNPLSPFLKRGHAESAWKTLALVFPLKLVSKAEAPCFRTFGGIWPPQFGCQGSFGAKRIRHEEHRIHRSRTVKLGRTPAPTWIGNWIGPTSCLNVYRLPGLQVIQGDHVLLWRVCGQVLRKPIRDLTSTGMVLKASWGSNL